MRSQILKLTIILQLLGTQSALASILPANKIKIPKEQKSNIGQLRFKQLIQKVVDPYKEIMSLYGANEFIVNEWWDKEEVNASTFKKDGIFYLNIYGGLARFSTMTEDAFTMILCHEIGHLIGGAPTWKPFNEASSEGQADYFATLKCFRKINQGESNQVNLKLVHPTAKKKCKQFSSTPSEYELCLRSSIAQMDLAKTIKELANLDKTPSFDTKDPYVRMFIIFNGYPNPQCRVDTMFAGSLCSNDINELMDLNLYNKGNCHQYKNDHPDTLRPKCWYVEREDKI